jgi:hypothetical protein
MKDCSKYGVSERWRDYGNELDIDLYEDQILERYPCIKANIENDKEKIYHLPFDQQYDTTKIEPDKGESYFMTVKEADDNGFRRAKR